MALTVGESDHNGSAVALARRSSHSYHNTHRNGSPGIIGPLTLSLYTVFGDTNSVSLDANRVDVGRRVGLGYGVSPAVTDVRPARVCVLTHGNSSTVHTRGDVDHRPVEQR